MRRLAARLGAFIAVIATPSVARAQVAAPSPEQEPVAAQQSVVVPPRLVSEPPVLNVPCAMPSLDVVVTLDQTGEVQDAILLDEVESAVAEAARSVIFALEFEPATRGGVPVAVKIKYPLACEAPRDGDVATNPAEPPSPLTDVMPASNPAPAEPPETISSDSEEHEVVVHGQSIVERLRQGANAVSVVELGTARQRTGSLGEVLSRQEGASVRTMGGLGGFTRFALDGLSNEQVRFFIDGVPLRYAGYSLGVANVPVDQLDHVEIYHGVVPAKFGADALGGAVNLSTLETPDGTTASASASTGSFGTTRLAASTTHRDSGENYMVRANAFRDRADNNFVLANVPLLDSRGQVTRGARPHFHNAYSADGVGLDLGIVDKPWAKHLVLRGFYTVHDKEIPHDDVGVENQNPYGEVTYGRVATGLLLMHQVASERVRVDTRLGFTNERLRYRDVSRCSYDWYGRCAVERRSRGEVSAVPVDARISDNYWLARIDGSWVVAPLHQLRLSVAPTLSSRSGKDDVLLEHVPDPLEAKRRFVTSVAGAEYEVRDEDDAWATNLFGKWYARYLDASETLPNGNHRDWHQLKNYGGAGASSRLNLTDGVYAKASYEYAIRFPSLEEIFGDGSQIVDNLELAAERSHNANVELSGRVDLGGGGAAKINLRGFGRFLSDRIWLQAVTGYSIYDNVPRSRVIGGEGMLQWTAPGEWLQLVTNATWLYSRDTSTSQPVRLPNDPWFWANAQATLTQRYIFVEQDSVGFDWNAGYVHGFPLSTGERGSAASRLRVDAQMVHTAALRYALTGATGTLSAAMEMNNVFDALVMDFYGVQRPGRAFFLKISFQLRRAPREKGQQQ